MNWDERTIGRELQHTVFNREVCVVDNCNWTGFEADLLIVEPKLRIIDVEIKISRADLKADYAKDKWINFGGVPAGTARAENRRVLWPRQVWKHYYAVPADIWNDDLVECLGSTHSGVLLVNELRNGRTSVRCIRRAKPNPAAKVLTADQVLDIARLATLRLWNAYDDVRHAEEFPGVIPHMRTPATQETPQMVMCLRKNRLIIDVTYHDEAAANIQYRGWMRARESGELAQLIDSAGAALLGPSPAVADSIDLKEFKAVEPLYEQAVEFAKSEATIGISKVQRKFQIGYNRAARLLERLAEDGVLIRNNMTGSYRRG